METPKTYRPATPTARRTAAYLALMCRFGFADLFDQVGKAALKAPTPLGVPSTGLRPAPTEAGEGAASLDIEIDLGGIVREMATGGAIQELAGIVLMLETPEEADDVPILDIVRAVAPFAQAWQLLMGTLLSSGMSSASTTKTPTASA